MRKIPSNIKSENTLLQSVQKGKTIKAEQPESFKNHLIQENFILIRGISLF
jgi:hypothetical protein